MFGLPIALPLVSLIVEVVLASFLTLGFIALFLGQLGRLSGGAPNWRLRGKLDVPVERFMIYPRPGARHSPDAGCRLGQVGPPAAGTVPRGLLRRHARTGRVDGERLLPTLVGPLELVPRLKQWHNALDPQFQVRMGDYFESSLQEKARRHSVTFDQVRAWKPAEAPRRASRRRCTAEDTSVALQSGKDS